MGIRLGFWHDVRCRDQTLKEAFQVLFSIFCFKEASVAEHMLFLNDRCMRNMTFIKSMHDWEIEMVTSSFNLLYSIRLS